MIKDSKQRLFEMMNRVAGMPLREENSLSKLPPGFSTSDFVPLQKDIEQTPCSTEISEEMQGDEMFNSIKTAKLDKGIEQEMQSGFKEKLAAFIRGDKQGVGATGRIHSGTLKDLIVDLSNVVDRRTGKKIDPSKLSGKVRKYYDVRAEDIPDFDLKKLADVLTTKLDDDKLLGKNQKMAKSNFFNISLPALKSIIYLERGDYSPENFYVLITCTQAKECVKWCYAQMGNYVQYDPPIRQKMQKLNYIINHWDEWKNNIIGQIQKIEGYSQKRGEDTVVRWHDAGDFISSKYLELAFDIARNTPNTIHYAYTKEVNMIKGAKIPPNFEFKFSLEGHQVTGLTKGDVLGVAAPAKLFSEFFKEKPSDIGNVEWKDMAGMWQFDEKTEKPIIKSRIINYYNNEHQHKHLFNLDDKNVIWYDDYIKMPHDRNLPHDRKWWVIIKPGDTDIPASRKDTQGIINLIHN